MVGSVSEFRNFQIASCVVGVFCLQSSAVTSVRFFGGNDLKAIFRDGTQPRERRKKLACYFLREGNVYTRVRKTKAVRGRIASCRIASCTVANLSGLSFGANPLKL